MTVVLISVWLGWEKLGQSLDSMWTVSGLWPVLLCQLNVLAFVPLGKTLPKMSTLSLVSLITIPFISPSDKQLKHLFLSLKFPFCLFQLYVLMGHFINMSLLMMETVIGRPLMCILTSVTTMISKDEVCVTFLFDFLFDFRCSIQILLSVHKV